MAQVSTINQYPPEQLYVRWGAFGSFGIHIFVAGVIVLIAFLTHVKSLEQLMKESGSIATNGPAPEQPMEVILQPDDLPPPPPTDNPEFIREIEKPKSVVTPPQAVIPKPVVQVQPKYTAPKATGSGESNTVSKLIVGSGGFPAPGYPLEAEVRHQAGTVVVNIQFNSEGSVSEAEVIESSGVSILDANARSWIRSHWHNASFASRSVSVPITYRLPGV